MKMKPEHYHILKEAMQKTIKDQILKEKNMGLSEIRIVWDILWATKLPSNFMFDLYGYLDDSHIQIVLLKILKETTN